MSAISDVENFACLPSLFSNPLSALCSMFLAVPDPNNDNRIVFTPHIAKDKSPGAKGHDPFPPASIVFNRTSNVWY
jgi:hypothetical protein